jgi:hypothetical protein
MPSMLTPFLVPFFAMAPYPFLEMPLRLSSLRCDGDVMVMGERGGGCRDGKKKVREEKT